MTILRIPVQYLVEYISPGNVQRQIANAHTFFNIINVLIQLPFSNFLVKISIFHYVYYIEFLYKLQLLFHAF